MRFYHSLKFQKLTLLQIVFLNDLQSLWLYSNARRCSGGLCVTSGFTIVLQFYLQKMVKEDVETTNSRLYSCRSSDSSPRSKVDGHNLSLAMILAASRYLNSPIQ